MDANREQWKRFLSKVSKAVFEGDIASARMIMGVHKSNNLLQLQEAVEDAYMKLRMVCESGVINPNRPGNMTFMRSDARDTANRLKRRGLIYIG